MAVVRRRPTAAPTDEPAITGYRELTLLGEGDGGRTWRAVRHADGQTMAVKVFDVALREERSHFRAEADALQTVTGPHLVPVADAGTTADGRPWMARPYLARGSLADRLAGHGPLSIKAAVSAALAATSALSALHERNLVHGDVRPANLLVDDEGAVTLADPLPTTLRQARVRHGDHGHLHHQPPEVLQGREWSAAGDIYALASTLHTLLTGHSPYEGDVARGVPALLLRVLAGPPPDVPRADLSPALRVALSTSLSPYPAQRPTVAALAAQLRTAVDGAGSESEADRLDTVPPPAAVHHGASMAIEGRPLGANYLLHEVIGRGAMGEVWRGSVRVGRHPVAVKVLRPELAEQNEYVSRFLQELQTLRRLNHPHVVRVRDQVWEGTTLAIVMNLIEGVDLRRFACGAVAPAIACELMAQVAEGLAAVHEQGVVHRDLKPENILVEHDGSARFHARITDFGIVRLAGGPALTQEGCLVGTVQYASPERIRDLPATPASDVYSLGIIAYELLTGRRPFVATESSDLRHAHLHQEPARPEGLPQAVWAVVSACLVKDPDARPHATQLADWFHSIAPTAAGLPALAPGPDAAGPFLAGMDTPDPPRPPSPVPPESPPAPPPPAPAASETESLETVHRPRGGVTSDAAPAAPPGRPPRWQMASAAVAIVVLALAAGVALGLTGGGDPEPPPPPPTTVARTHLLFVTGTARPVANGVIDLSFRGVRDRPGFQRYAVLRDNTPLPDRVPPEATSFQLGNLDANTQHCFAVVAVFVSENPPTDPPSPSICLQARIQ